MVAFDALEQLDAGPFQLVAADARRDRSSHNIEVGLEETVGECAHGEPRDLAVLEQNLVLSRQRNRGMKLMGPTAQGFELLARARSVGRLGEPTLAECQGLVCAQ